MDRFQSPGEQQITIYLQPKSRAFGLKSHNFSYLGNKSFAGRLNIGCPIR